MSPVPNQAPRHGDVWRSEGMGARIPKLGIIYGRVVSFTSRPLLPTRKEPWYPLKSGLCGPQCRSGQCGDKKIPVLQGIKPRPSKPQPSYYIASVTYSVYVAQEWHMSSMKLISLCIAMVTCNGYEYYTQVTDSIYRVYYVSDLHKFIGKTVKAT
jgi:hypothetical protein